VNERFTAEDDERVGFLGSAELIAQAIESPEDRAEVISLIAFRQAEAGNVEVAVDLVQTINDSYLRDQALTGLAAQCIQLGAADHAGELAEMIEDDGSYALATEQMAVAYAESGQFEKSIELADGLAESGPTLSRIALACVARDLVTQALELARSVDYADLKVPVLIELAAKALQDGRNTEALELLDEATTAAAEIEFFEQRISALVAIASLSKKCGQEERAFEILSQAQQLCTKSEDSAKDAAFAQIASGFAELQRSDQADQAIAEIENAFQFAHATASVALESHRAGDTARTRTLLAQAIETVRTEEVYGEQSLMVREVVLDELARSCALVARFDEALEMVGLMNSEDQQYRTVTEIAKLYVSSGNHQRVFEVTGLIKDNYARVLCEVEVVDAFIASEQTELADHTLSEARTRTAAIERPYQKAIALIAVASRFARREQRSIAAEVLFEALNALARIDGYYLQSRALITLAGKYRELGEEEGQREEAVLEEMRSKVE